MTRKILLCGCATGALAITGLAAGPALAAGTAAGTTITNSVTVEYEVAGIEQDDETASNEVVVDRKVDLIVERTDDTATTVTPGETSQAVTFQVENLSNDTLDFELGAAQTATGSSAGISGNDGFDVDAPFTYYLDTGGAGAGVYDASDTLITHLDALVPDSPVVVHVVTPLVPTGTADDEIAAVTLTATAKANDNGASLGSDLTEAATNTAGVDTIFADEAGVTDSIRDAAFSATDDFVVVTATLTATKTSRIVDGDFGTGAAIPGATIEYCVAVSNAAGGADASNITIGDGLPLEVTFDEDFGVLVGGADCDTPGPDTGSENLRVVTGTIASLPAGSTQTLIFRAVID
jgi:uncharacterized repeat protein (TIGR01451 family)